MHAIMIAMKDLQASWAIGDVYAEPIPDDRSLRGLGGHPGSSYLL